MALVYYFFGDPIDSHKSSGPIITSFSILIGLLLNVNILIFNRLQAARGNKDREDYIKQMFATISFSILIGLLAVVTILLKPYTGHQFHKLCDSIIVGIGVTFILNLLMVLQRLYLLFDSESNP